MFKPGLKIEDKSDMILNKKDAREENEYFQIVFESIGDGVIITDLSGIIVRMNKEGGKITGWDVDKACGQPFYHVFKISSGEKGDVFDDPMKRALEKGKKVGLKNNTILTTLDGGIKYISASVSPIKDIKEMIKGVVIVFRDITRIKQSEKHLKSLYMEMQKAMDAAEMANKAKNQFFTNISHDIRTPLNGIMGAADLVLATPLNNEQVDNIEIIKKCSYILLKKINDLIDISRIEAGDVIIEMKNLNIREIIDDTIKLYSCECAEKGIYINKCISPGIPDVLVGDAEKFKQVVDNIVSNAVKFTDSGEIAINAEVVHENKKEIMVRVSISDTGVGISKDDLRKLFKPFNRAEGNLNRKYGGSGLGLFICEKLVSMMSGNIEVESEEGKGSTFSFTAKLKKVVKTPMQTTAKKSMDKSMDKSIDKSMKTSLNKEEKADDYTVINNNRNNMYNCVEKEGELVVYYKGEAKDKDTVSLNSQEFIKKCKKCLMELEASMNNIDLIGVEKYSCILKDLAGEYDLPEVKKTALKIAMCARKGALEPVFTCLEKLKECFRMRE